MLYGEFPFSIGVLKSRDNHMPVGVAFEVGRTDDGRALWRLVIDQAEPPQRFVIVDREFRPAG